jgi:hypothetical protein
MIEPLFGSAGPVWTAIPPTGFVLQTPTLALGGGPLGNPTFGSSNVPGVGSGMLTPQPFQNLSTVGFPAGVSLARNPSSFVPDQMMAVTAPSLLAAVAMRRGQPQGPTNDQEVEEFIYDALELLPGTADVEVRCEGARVTLTGSVQHKRLKRDVGEIAWAIPALHDVQNNVTIASRRRARAAAREAEGPATAQGRKQG